MHEVLGLILSTITMTTKIITKKKKWLTTQKIVINQLHWWSFRNIFHFLGKTQKVKFKLFWQSRSREGRLKGPLINSPVPCPALLSPQCTMVTECRTGEQHPKSDAWDSPLASWQGLAWKERRWTRLRKVCSEASVTQTGRPPCLLPAESGIATMAPRQGV